MFLSLSDVIFVWYLIVSIPDLCHLSYFVSLLYLHTKRVEINEVLVQILSFYLD